MATALISDLHLGAASRSDLLVQEPVRERLLAAIRDCERLVLLGDTLELRDRPLAAALASARPFFERVGEAFAGREVVLVPGNHDHRLLGAWLDRSRDGARTVALDERIADPHPVIGRIHEWLGRARLEVRYPGLWIRDDVYATHGHYLDSHLTLPTIERLAVATVDRIGGRPTGVRAGPHDYEKVHAPVYDLLFDLAQGVRPVDVARKGRPPSVRIWEMIGGASGRARTIRGRLLRSAVIPGTLRGLERAGLGSFGRDFSLAEIGRSGVEAMHVVADRLGIDAGHLIFGHIHRRGPLPGEDGRRATDPLWEIRGRQAWNAGNWLYSPAMLDGATPATPFWPGSVVIVPEAGPPELRELLTDATHAELGADKKGA